MKARKAFKVIVLIGVLILNTAVGASAYDPFKKPTVKNTTSTKTQKSKRVNLPPPEPVYKEKWVLPPTIPERYEVLGTIDNYYIVYNINSRRIILWGKNETRNHCKIINGEVTCYEKKRVRVR